MTTLPPAGRGAWAHAARYPFTPLEDHLRAGIASSDSTGCPVGVPRVARALGVDRQQIHRWRSYGITATQAIDLADRAGVHYLTVWPTLDDLERRQRANLRQRRYRRRNAAYRARQLAARRRYYEQAADYERARERARYRLQRAAS